MDPLLILLFPLGIAISTVSAMIGIGGAIFFTPYFIVVIGLDPLLAFTAGLFIEMMGFASGAIGYGREHLIDYFLTKRIIVYTIPSCIAGVAIAGYVDSRAMVMPLIFLLIFHAHGFLTKRVEPIPKDPKFVETEFEHRDYFLNKAIKASSIMGGLLLGMVSSGLGEINEYNFLENLKMRPGQASGTSIFILIVTGLVSVMGRLILFLEIEIADIKPILPVVLVTIPSVVIGAQAGVRLSENMRKGRFVHMVGVSFLVIAFITFYEVFLSH